MLIDEIKKIAKDDADLSRIEGLIGDLDPLKNLKTAEDAIAFIERNPVFRKALDSETSKRVENALTKFQADKMPGIIEDRLADAKNPKETPEQKALREMQVEMKAMKDEKALLVRKDALRTKAKELGLDEDIAENLAGFGDGAFETIEFLGAKFKGKVSTEVETQMKNRLGDQAPKKAVEESGDFDLTETMSKFSYL